MELRHLRYFVAVAETLNFTQAAADCGVAQSALSQQIARLERDVGASLFSRSPRRPVQLTDAGAVLLPWARRMLSDAEQAKQDIDALVGVRRGRLRLGLIQTLAGAVDLAAVLGAYRARYPGVELSVSYNTSEALLAAANDGELDLALVGLGPDRIPAELDHRLLSEDRLVAIVAPDHRLAARSQIDLAELAGDEFVWFSKGTGLRRAVESACERAGLTPPRNLEVGLISEMIRLAAHGLGVTVVPGSAVPAASGEAVDGARVLRLTDPQALHRVAVVYRADRLSGAAAAFLEAIATNDRQN